MIDPRDIRDLATELSLQETVVEKDYVLGWLLAGISEDALLSRAWVFKGGTCLKKVHFETYRFSEDLDFTVTDPDALDPERLRACFKEISAWLYERTGIEVPAARVRFEEYENPRGRRSVQGRVYYKGPLNPPRTPPKIKLDLTTDEVLVEPPERRRVFHPYTDDPADGIHAQCYSYTEIFAEKTRALQERGLPRDLYDVVNLFRRADARPDRAALRRVLEAKCAYKGIGLPTLNAVRRYEPKLRQAWVSMLDHQLPVPVPFEIFWGELPAFFDWLERGEAMPAPKPRPLTGGERLLRPQLGGFPAAGYRNAALEAIRFAAANHLCVELDYRDEKGKRDTRLIEPYSLRRTQAGDLLLHAERVTGTGDRHRAYRVDRILGARVTTQTFVPKYLIELAPQLP